MLYVYYEDTRGDSFDLEYSTDLEDIRRKAIGNKSYLTASELKRTDCYICGYSGVSSKEELYDLDVMPDPDFYETV